MSEGITGVILNWKRPDNVNQILMGWRESGYVGHAIVWNNNPATYFRHPWAQAVNASEDLGLYTRFAAACLAPTEAVLIQDDDVELPADSIRDLHDGWRADPDIIHGVFGRGPRPEDGTYAAKYRGNEDVPIVLTRALVASRRHAATFFADAPAFAALQAGSQPPGNGEDIIFNYVAMRHSGRLNRIHDVAADELPAPHSIWERDRAVHMEHRTQLMRACQAWLAGAGVEL